MRAQIDDKLKLLRKDEKGPYRAVVRMLR